MDAGMLGAPAARAVRPPAWAPLPRRINTASRARRDGRTYFLSLEPTGVRAVDSILRCDTRDICLQRPGITRDQCQACSCGPRLVQRLGWRGAALCPGIRRP